MHRNDPAPGKEFHEPWEFISDNGAPTVLLVDDLPANLLALEATLDDLGLNLLKAHSGEEALRCLLGREVAAVLLDVHMHGMDGFETARLIRSREVSRYTPIIFLTAHETDRETVERAYALGAVDFILKPIVPVILRAKVSGFIDLFRQAERLRRMERAEFERQLADEAGRQSQRAEEHIRQNEETLAEFFEKAAIGLHWVGPDGIILRVNQAELDLLGYTREEYVGHPTADFHADPEVISDILGRLQRGETLQAYEARLRCKDGSIKHVLIDSNVRWEDGRFIHTRCFTRDITARKRAEEQLLESFDQLRASEQHFRLMADAVPVLIWVSDQTKGCTWFNKSWLDFTGRPMRDLLGNGWAEDVHPDDFDRCLDIYITHFDQRRPFSMEYRLKRHDGEYRWVSDNGIPRFDSDGTFVGYVGSCVDFSDRKSAEEKLREADRLKDEFLAMLAHELRNPLAPVRNAVQVLRAKSPPVPELAWAGDVIDRQVQQMTRLVDDLLDVSRITRGKIELRKERIKLAAVVSVALETSRPLIDKGGHALSVALPTEPVCLEGDPTRLAQVLSNLLNNAAKYTDRGGRISLTAERDGGRILIRVRDTGIGLSPDMLPRIFEMFTQVDRSLERSQSGLGIGLTLVRTLVEAHEGTVEARSEGPGRGSEFVVALPVVQDAERREDGNTANDGANAVVTSSSRILVVDDNRDAADSLGMLLRMMGHEVHIAYDGLEAVSVAQSRRPEVVLLDIGLPKLNGYEAARLIKKELGGDNLVLIALTGWGQEEDKRRSQEAGFDRHFTKPVNLDALQEVLAALHLSRARE